MDFALRTKGLPGWMHDGRYVFVPRVEEDGEVVIDICLRFRVGKHTFCVVAESVPLAVQEAERMKTEHLDRLAKDGDAIDAALAGILAEGA